MAQLAAEIHKIIDKFLLLGVEWIQLALRIEP
jgi:hypothetical protein